MLRCTRRWTSSGSHFPLRNEICKSSRSRRTALHLPVRPLAPEAPARYVPTVVPHPFYTYRCADCTAWHGGGNVPCLACLYVACSPKASRIRCRLEWRSVCVVLISRRLLYDVRSCNRSIRDRPVTEARVRATMYIRRRVRFVFNADIDL